MTLQSYLSSGAVEDVRALLECGQLDGKRLFFPDGSLMLCDYECDAWRAVVLASLGKANVSYCCYYREPSPGQFIVSDCGETVSVVMRRTWKTWRQAFDFAWGCLDLAPRIQGRMGGDIWIDTDSAADLPAAIVSVLGAVAKVRESLDKERW